MASQGPQPPVMSKPLEGVTVLDLTVALAGPYATLLLAGLGATVIKVENPDRGGDTSRNNAPYVGAAGISLAREADQDMSVAMLERGRNKLSMTLNLKHPGARAKCSASWSGTPTWWSRTIRREPPIGSESGYAFCSAVNERIIYTAISGFGATGARRAQKGMDTIFQAMSGLMTVSGSDGDPPVRSGIPFGDMTGPLFAVIGTLAALHHRGRTGLGQFVDVSLLGALASVVATEPFDKLEELGIPDEDRQLGAAARAVWDLQDRRRTHRSVRAARPDDARRVHRDGPARAGRRRALLEPGPPRAQLERAARPDRRLGRRADHRKAVNLLQAAGTPAAPVRAPHEAVRDPELLARGETMQLVHPRFGPVDDLIGSGFPIGFSSAHVGYEQPSPYLGEHNEFILRGMLGRDDDEIAALRADGII